MKCLIVDDKNSCKQLEKYVSEYETLALIRSFHDKKSFLEEVSNITDIDIIFVDIKMIGLECLEIINNLKKQPNVIIVTSTDEFALKSFDYGVVDYILKPVSYPRFFRAVDKTARYFLHNELSRQKNEDIYIRKGTELIKLKLSDLQLAEGCENYVRLFMGRQRYAIHFTMKAIESQLPSQTFKRVHKSYIVNCNCINAIKEDLLEINIGDQVKNVPIGKTYKESLIESLNLL